MEGLRGYAATPSRSPSSPALHTCTRTFRQACAQTRICMYGSEDVLRDLRLEAPASLMRRGSLMAQSSQLTCNCHILLGCSHSSVSLLLSGHTEEEFSKQMVDDLKVKLD